MLYEVITLALKDCGLDIAGDPAISFTETHQVIINVGYARAPEIARRRITSYNVCYTKLLRAPRQP